VSEFVNFCGKVGEVQFSSECCFECRRGAMI
jgi:hypothetical protein